MARASAKIHLGLLLRRANFIQQSGPFRGSRLIGPLDGSTAWREWVVENNVRRGNEQNYFTRRSPKALQTEGSYTMANRALKLRIVFRLQKAQCSLYGYNYSKHQIAGHRGSRKLGPDIRLIEWG